MRDRMTVLAVAAVLVAGCGAPPEVGDATGPGADAVELGQEGTAPAPAGDGASPTREPAAGSGPGGRVDPVETVRADEAGEADVRVVDGRRLELVQVRAASGWTYRLGAHSRDELELDFEHESGRVIELEVELDDGRLEAEAG